MYRKFKFEKLVRDHLPSIMEARHTIYHLKTPVNLAEKVEFLKAKMAEEADEVCSAHTQDELIEEMADVLEVIHGFSHALNLDFSAIEQKRIEKRAEKGGFEQCIYIKNVEVTAENESLQYYLKHPDKYPELLAQDEATKSETTD